MEEHSDYAICYYYYYKITTISGRTPRRVKTSVHNVDEPNKGRKFKQVQKVDGPHEGSRHQSTTWTDLTRVEK